MSDIEKYERYKRKCELTGNKVFKFMEAYKNKIGIEEYIENKEEKRVIVIPDFVSFICTEAFMMVEQDLEIVNKGERIKDCYKIFSCYKGKEIRLSEFNTSKVRDMSYMFDRCNNLVELDLSNFDTSEVTDMDLMFNGCKSLRRLKVSNFDIRKVIYTYSMFNGCRNLEKLDLSTWKVSKSTDVRGMFLGCSVEELIINKQLDDLLKASNEVVGKNEYIGHLKIV